MTTIRTDIRKTERSTARDSTSQSTMKAADFNYRNLRLATLPLTLILFILIAFFITENSTFLSIEAKELKIGEIDSLQIETNHDVDASNNSETATEPEFLLPAIDNNSIYLPTIKTYAPVSWGIINQNRKINKALEEGVVHIAGTALPGQKGNVYIAGHSSNNSWAKGGYNQVFADLDKLAIDDIIYLRNGMGTFVYQVRGKDILPANDISPMNQGENRILALSTCWPVGTSEKRLVITAEQTYPAVK